MTGREVWTFTIELSRLRHIALVVGAVAVVLAWTLDDRGSLLRVVLAVVGAEAAALALVLSAIEVWHMVRAR